MNKYCYFILITPFIIRIVSKEETGEEQLLPIQKYNNKNTQSNTVSYFKDIFNDLMIWRIGFIYITIKKLQL